jgi:hypothetical protein
VGTCFVSFVAVAECFLPHSATFQRAIVWVGAFLMPHRVPGSTATTTPRRAPRGDAGAGSPQVELFYEALSELPPPQAHFFDSLSELPPPQVRFFDALSEVPPTQAHFFDALSELPSSDDDVDKHSSAAGRQGARPASHGEGAADLASVCSLVSDLGDPPSPEDAKRTGEAGPVQSFAASRDEGPEDLGGDGSPAASPTASSNVRDASTDPKSLLFAKRVREDGLEESHAAGRLKGPEDLDGSPKTSPDANPVALNENLAGPKPSPSAARNEDPEDRAGSTKVPTVADLFAQLGTFGDMLPDSSDSDDLESLDEAGTKPSPSAARNEDPEDRVGSTKVPTVADLFAQLVTFGDMLPDSSDSDDLESLDEANL